MNKEWHQRHVLPKNGTLAERIDWHREHQKRCACRPIPAKLMAQMVPPAPSPARTTEGGKKPTTKKAQASSGHRAAPTDPRFAPVIDAFTNDRQVTTGGKGFGSAALKVGGKIFAMISSRGKFVAKLPRERVDELVRLGKGEYFDPGHGRLMKQWVALEGAEPSWTDIAKEARRFVRGSNA